MTLSTAPNVCITGVGLVTPAGTSRSDTWKNVLAGKSMAGHIAQFDAKGWPVNIGCEVKNFHLNESSILEQHARLLTRPSEFGAEAAYEAMIDSNIANHIDPSRLGTIMGTGIGVIKPLDILSMLNGHDLRRGLNAIAQQLEKKKPNRDFLMMNHPSTLSRIISSRWNCQGLSTTTSTACAAGAQAIGYGYRAIREGRLDAAIVGGADSLSGELLHAGFCLLGVLSSQVDTPQTASKPYDKQRDGFVASEGAGVLILEREDFAKARGAKIYATLSGYGESENAYRMTDLPEDARGAINSMRFALRDADMSIDAITYINGHGTSTEQNDRVEIKAIEEIFYQNGAKPFVGSTKSMLGHGIAAAGAIEAALCCLSVKEQKIPPNINLDDPIGHDRIRYASTTTIETPVKAVLSNSFGFGGTNATLILKESGI